MIYKFRVSVKKGKETIHKEFLLDAENHTKLYQRIQSQYCVPKENVEILEEIDDSTIDINVKKEKRIR